MTIFVVGLIAFLLGRYMGWREAHLTIAVECQRLGKFFVNKVVYHCTAIEWAYKEPEKKDGN